MTPNELNELENLLNKWFAETNFAPKRFWEYNSIAKVIKLNLKKLSHWKYTIRGKPNNKFNFKKIQIQSNNTPKVIPSYTPAPIKKEDDDWL